MKISEILNSKKVTISFEIFPPKKQEAFDSVKKTALSLSSLKPDFISITYGAGGSTQTNTSDLAQTVENSGTASLAHLTCVRSTKEQLLQTIQTLKQKNINNVLALRGDLPKDAFEGENLFPSGFFHASDLVPLLKQNGFCVGGACYPEGHPESSNRDTDIENLKHKVEAGVDFLTTQMIFDNDMLYSFLYRLQSAGIHVPVLAGIMPITNANQVSKMVDLSNAYIPRKLLSFCDRFRHDSEAMKQAGIAYATDQIIDLISNGIRGIHIYTMNKPEIAESIVKNVDSIIKAVNK
ncbi:MAG: methylenetetrahydrofolate reductase [NAD(P)H] [Treponema berlinense]|uniref:methylenetetrahydrofolate reductase [NAD(P)H] n=1 Tax=Treponema berlinense TaxID=225004 RepID=UPI0023547EDA|nr:methylenetetrahydrofolate reductase [NAD(P)H] [Treponema berlinense]MDY3707354.1 methylenetetrahydrofolate reductase [NAD(P)H] [Treponema berlinense]